jgi:hypothetical protein
MTKEARTTIAKIIRVSLPHRHILNIRMKLLISFEYRYGFVLR